MNLHPAQQPDDQLHGLQALELEQSMWADACLAAGIFAHQMLDHSCSVRPAIVVRAQAGPVRDAWLQHMQSLCGDSSFRRLPLGISDERLLGGLDLAATLASGVSKVRKGVLARADEGVLIVPVADAIEANIASNIAMALDDGFVRVERDGFSARHQSRFSLVLFDESEADDQGVSDTLMDRAALHIDLSNVSIRAIGEIPEINRPSHDFAKAEIEMDDKQRERICATALALGLPSLRPALQTMAVCKTLAALKGHSSITDDDIADAVRLCLMHRALVLPANQDDMAEQDQNPPAEQQEQKAETPEMQSPDSQTEAENADHRDNAESPSQDMLLDALAANLPKGLLQQLEATARTADKKAQGRSGAFEVSNLRGRPLSSRRGALRDGKRLDLIATLRAAVPWQRVRREQTGDSGKIHIRASDFHVRRYKQKSGSSCIFVVDASGSTALNRLAETKGAVELLLGESYARRDYVGLVSLRGPESEVLLAPTRSLVRAKRSLAAMPGGGGTPLAHGLQSALTLAQEEARRGRTPSIVIMTDGSANVDLEGMGGRARAVQDASQVAAIVQASGFKALLIDVGRQPSQRAKTLADDMGATYVPMPFASSKALSNAARAGAL